jgi:hypothetical protein
VCGWIGGFSAGILPVVLLTVLCVIYLGDCRVLSDFRWMRWVRQAHALKGEDGVL